MDDKAASVLPSVLALGRQGDEPRQEILRPERGERLPDKRRQGEQRRAGVEHRGSRPELLGLAAQAGLLLVEDDAAARAGEQAGGDQPTDASSDDGDPRRAAHGALRGRSGTAGTSGGDGRTTWGRRSVTSPVRSLTTSGTWARAEKTSYPRASMSARMPPYSAPISFTMRCAPNPPSHRTPAAARA